MSPPSLTPPSPACTFLSISQGLGPWESRRRKIFNHFGITYWFCLRPGFLPLLGGSDRVAPLKRRSLDWCNFIERQQVMRRSADLSLKRLRSRRVESITNKICTFPPSPGFGTQLSLNKRYFLLPPLPPSLCPPSPHRSHFHSYFSLRLSGSLLLHRAEVFAGDFHAPSVESVMAPSALHRGGLSPAPWGSLGGLEKGGGGCIKQLCKKSLGMGGVDEA